MDLRQSTASQEISLGQFLDSTDGDTEENGLTIANTDIKLRKHNTTTLANKNSGGATNISNGVYHATLDATDSDTLGMLEIYVHVAGALAVKAVFNVLTQTAFDAKYTGTYNNISPAEVNTECDTAISDAALATAASLATVDTNVDSVLVDTGTTIPAQITALNDFDPATEAVANVTLVATTTTNTDMRGTDSAATAANLAVIDTNVDAILIDTGTTIPAQITALNDVSVSEILTTAMTESYAADGVAPTLAQALYLIQQTIGDFSIAGTTITVKEIDGSTPAATYTLDDGTSPTSRTRAT